VRRKGVRERRMMMLRWMEHRIIVEEAKVARIKAAHV
jgi:hypothetical protein